MAHTALQFPNFGFSKPRKQKKEPKKASPGASNLVGDYTKRLQNKDLRFTQSPTRLARKGGAQQQTTPFGTPHFL